MTTTLKFKARPGSLLAEPGSYDRFIGRTALPMPPDGWPVGTKPEARHPIIEAGDEVKREDRARWAIVLDALRKGIDLEPADDQTREFCCPAAPVTTATPPTVSPRATAPANLDVPHTPTLTPNARDRSNR